MWGIKLKGFIRQVYLSYSQGYDDNGEEGKENNVKYDMDKDDMNDKDNDENLFFSKVSVVRHCPKKCKSYDLVFGNELFPKYQAPYLELYLRSTLVTSNIAVGIKANKGCIKMFIPPFGVFGTFYFYNIISSNNLLIWK